MTAFQTNTKHYFKWRPSIALWGSIVLLAFFWFCLGTAIAQTTSPPLAKFTMNYMFATGCMPPDWPNYDRTDGNPYCAAQSGGQIQAYTATPGLYCVEVVDWSG